MDIFINRASTNFLLIVGWTTWYKNSLTNLYNFSFNLSDPIPCTIMQSIEHMSLGINISFHYGLKPFGITAFIFRAQMVGLFGSKRGADNAVNWFVVKLLHKFFHLLLARCCSALYCPD